MDLPAVEVDVVFAVVFVASDVEADDYVLTCGVGIEDTALVFEDFELDVLRIFVVFSGDDEFTLAESALESLGIEDEFDFAFEFVHDDGLLDDSLSIFSACSSFGLKVVRCREDAEKIIRHFCALVFFGVEVWISVAVLVNEKTPQIEAVES